MFLLFFPFLLRALLSSSQDVCRHTMWESVLAIRGVEDLNFSFFASSLRVFESSSLHCGFDGFDYPPT